jgi:hypothetical protein
MRERIQEILLGTNNTNNSPAVILSENELAKYGLIAELEAPPGERAPAGDPAAGPAGVSFVGIPFPEEKADWFFGQLTERGIRFVRLPVPWEAIEHTGPGLYDESYLAFLRKILLAAERHGVEAMILPRQRAWSRFTGGEGAPAWTLECAGISLGSLSTEADRKFAAGLMYTCFFGGNLYTPGLKAGSVPVQDWLQGLYTGAYRHCFRRLKNCKALTAFGLMTGPSPGAIDPSRFHDEFWRPFAHAFVNGIGANRLSFYAPEDLL